MPRLRRRPWIEWSLKWPNTSTAAPSSSRRTEKWSESSPRPTGCGYWARSSKTTSSRSLDYETLYAPRSNRPRPQHDDPGAEGISGDSRAPRGVEQENAEPIPDVGRPLDRRDERPPLS